MINSLAEVVLMQFFLNLTDLSEKKFYFISPPCQGLMGKVGLQGDQGRKGEPGPQGLKGESGVPGSAGDQVGVFSKYVHINK